MVFTEGIGEGVARRAERFAATRLTPLGWHWVNEERECYEPYDFVHERGTLLDVKCSIRRNIMLPEAYVRARPERILFFLVTKVQEGFEPMGMVVRERLLREGQLATHNDEPFLWLPRSSLKKTGYLLNDPTTSLDHDF